MNVKKIAPYVIVPVMVVMVLLGLAVATGPAAATHIDPTFVPDNPTCSMLAPAGTTWFELKVEPVADGQYSDGLLTVTIDVRDTASGPVFDWSSNIGVDAIFVKGGPDGNLYQYDPPGPEVTSDTGLHAPVNPQNDMFFGLSHISFCYDVVPSVRVDKSGDELSKVGDDVTYNFTIENDGDTPITLLSVSDTLLGNLTQTAIDNDCEELDAGESCSFSIVRAVDENDPDPLPNTVTVEYEATLPGDSTTTVSDSDDHEVNLFQPSITFDKSVDGDLSKVGDSVTFTLTLNNTSSLDSPDLECTISDPLIGVNEQVTLAAGDPSHILNVPYTFQEGDSDPFINTASASCSPAGFPNVLEKSDSVEVNLFQPSVTIDKTGDELSKVGDEVNYTVTVSNNSSADTPVLTCTVEDSLLGTVFGPATLPLGDTVLNESRTVAEDDPDPLVNTAAVTCTIEGFPNILEDEDSHETNLFQPRVQVEKLGAALSKEGDTVTYEFRITNTSSDDSPNLILDSISDDVLGDLADDAPADCDELAVGASCQFSVEYTIQAGDPDPLVNTVTVHYHPDGFPNDITDTASHETNLFQPSITIDKTGDALSKVGDLVNYTITVDNTSSEDSPNLTCTITDPLLGIDVTVNLAWDAADHVINASRTVQSGDPDPLINTASVTCTVDGFGNVVGPVSDSHSTELFQPSVVVTKDGPASAEVGETITYNFTVNNTGSSDGPDLVLDSVTDTVLGDLTAAATAAGCGTLASGASCNFTVDYTVGVDDPNPLVNVITVHYHPEGFPNDISDEDDHVLEIIQRGNEGCTPGYWKNHLDAWAPAGYSPDQTVESVFDVPDEYGLDNDTLLEALNYIGGPRQKGAAQILLRAAVAALLNASHPDVDYPRAVSAVIAGVNEALATGNRSTMLILAVQLDADNNLGCPLN